MMAAVGPRNTAPELFVRHRLHAAGYRYRLHVGTLPGKPDIVLHRFRLVIFVNGCFWHGHNCPRGKRPASNTSFWNAKLDKNIKRDRRIRRELHSLGWSYTTIWECRLVEGTVGLHDPAMAMPVEDEITLQIVDQEIPPKKKPASKPVQPPKGGDSGDKKGEGEPAPTHGLPQYVLLTRDGRHIGENETEKWPEEFSENDGGTIHDLGDGQLIYKINYDNTYHLKYRMQARGDIAKDVVTEKYILGMRILMLGYEHALHLTQERNGAVSEYADEIRRLAARGAASTVLALAENLPKIVDSSSVSDDAE